MNERIKALAEQANNDVSGNAFSMARYNEKFAELIVRECGNVAWKCGSEFINNQIKNHFGLEE